MSKLPPIPKVLLAGALATLCTSILVWALAASGTFIVLGVAIVLPQNVLFWGLERIGWGALAGIVFLFPLFGGWVQWKRGLAAAAVPIGALLLVIYPWGREGWFGLNAGPTTPFAVIVLWVLWGVLAGWLLDRWNFRISTEE